MSRELNNTRRVTFVDVDGNQRTVEASDGQTVMEVAVHHGITGIVAECGGACACGTCHAHIDDEWASVIDPPTDNELAMLECVIEPTGSSRLTCQIEVTKELDGLIIHLARSQY